MSIKSVPRSPKSISCHVSRMISGSLFNLQCDLIHLVLSCMHAPFLLSCWEEWQQFEMIGEKKNVVGEWACLVAAERGFRKRAVLLSL